MVEKWKYSIWCEGGLLHECDDFDTEEEAVEEAESDLASYFDDADTETEPDEYWYEISSYETEVEVDDEEDEEDE